MSKTIYFILPQKIRQDVILRKKEIYDGATASGNSLMAGNLIMLSVFFDKPEWKARAEHMLSLVIKFAEKYPSSFGMWCLHLQFLIYGLKEIVITGENYRLLQKQILKEYMPLKVLMASDQAKKDWPLLAEKIALSNQTNIYICENYSCLRPATSFEEFKNQLTKLYLTKKTALQNNSY